MEIEYFINKKGKLLGPFTILQIITLAQNGKICPNDLIKRKNGTWALAKDSDELSNILTNQMTDTGISKCQICGIIFQISSQLTASEKKCPRCEVPPIKPFNTDSNEIKLLETFADFYLKFNPNFSLIRQHNLWKSRAAIFAIVIILTVLISSLIFLATYQKGNNEDNLSDISDFIDPLAIVGKWEGEFGEITFFPNNSYEERYINESRYGETLVTIKGKWLIKNDEIYLSDTKFGFLKLIKLSGNQLIIKPGDYPPQGYIRIK